jgi:uncharacterized membrane protein
MERTRQVPRFIPHLAGGRLLVASVAGLLVGVGLPGAIVALRLVAAWDAFALVLLTLAWIFIWRADAAETRRHAAGEDPGRRTVWVVATLSSTFSLFAAVFVLRQAHSLAPDHAVLWVALCLVAVVASWLLTHTAWTLRYAHLYYRDDDEGGGGLSFPGDRKPDAFDFAYFAFTIGICFQTSDITIVSPQIRRSVLFHSCQSFAYTTAIVALALNLAFGFVT